MRLILCCLLMVATATTAKKCYDPVYADCSGWDQQTCSLGYDENGCDLGNECQPMTGSMRCNVQCPCMSGEIQCDDWVGDLQCPTFTCYPAPTNTHDCPTFCPNQCDPSTEQTCPGMKLTPDGCMDEETCVPYGSECPYDQNGCSWIMDEDNPSCGPDENYCDFDYDSVGCPIAGTASCVPMEEECPPQSHDTYGCPIIEEVECTDNQVRCEDYYGVFYDYYGCQIAYSVPCFDPESDPNAVSCDYPYDPTIEQLCDLGYDENGNFMGRYTIPLDDGAGCPMYCDVTCSSEYEEPCYEYDSEGCPVPPYCEENGQCYSTYDSNGCLVDIYVEPTSPYDMSCPGAYKDGCQEMDVIVPAESSPGCPGYCPEDCGYDGMLCEYPPGTEMDPWCAYQECAWTGEYYSEYTGEACPVQCRTYCMEGELKCSGGLDPQGCPYPDTCITSSPGCPQLCPAACNEYQSACQIVDDISGCVVAETCIESYVYSYLGSSLCPNHCPVVCGDYEVECEGSFREDGCQESPFCMPAETGCPDSREFYDEYGCSFDVYVECDYNTMSCDLGTDPYTGCAMGNHCVEYQGFNCYDQCPPNCNPGERLCGGQPDQYGCNTDYSCIPQNAACPEDLGFPPGFDQYFAG